VVARALQLALLHRRVPDISLSPTLPQMTPAPATPHCAHVVGACLTLFLPKWMAHFPDNPWILDLVREGVYLSFHTPLTLTTTPVWIKIPQQQDKALALRTEIAALSSKRAIEPLPTQRPRVSTHTCLWSPSQEEDGGQS
jgi:hypothetical protein